LSHTDLRCLESKKARHQRPTTTSLGWLGHYNARHEESVKTFIHNLTSFVFSYVRDLDGVDHAELGMREARLRRIHLNLLSQSLYEGAQIIKLLLPPMSQP
jgi:hypothetical protein